MKYVIAGTISSEWVGHQTERVSSAKTKATELGITFEGIYYTQGAYDFVDIVDATDEGAMLAFSVWYARQGYGRISTMPAFDEAAMDAAIAKTG